MRRTKLPTIVGVAVVLGWGGGLTLRAQEMDDWTAQTNASYYLQQAQSYYMTAQQKFEAGEYDESADLANKAREYAEKFRAATRLRNRYYQAVRLIREAETLISDARRLKVSEEDLAPSVERFDDANAFFNNRDWDAAIAAAQQSIALTRDLLARLQARQGPTPQTGGRVLTEAEEGWKTYTVRLIPQRRDCLWRIAEYDFIYGDPWKWPAIWKANKDQIVDPDLIYPGQVFRIPPLPEAERTKQLGPGEYRPRTRR